MIRRTTSILLLFAWLILGTGLLAQAHDLQHIRDDADHGTPIRHDATNCQIHAQLQTPALPVFTVALPTVDEPLVARHIGSDQVCLTQSHQLTHCPRGPPGC